MFCYKCGYQIPDDAQFCSKCGAAQSTNATMMTSNTQPESKDLDREAIKIYLSNILALECMKVKLNNDYCEAEKKLKYEDENNYIQCFPISNGYIWLAYHDGKVHIGAFNDGDYGGAYTGEFLNREHMTDGKGFVKYVWGQEVINHRGRFYWGIVDDNSLPTIKSSSFWWDIGGNNMLQQKFRQSSARDSFLELYSQFKQTAPQQYQDNLEKIIKPLKNRVAGISDEWKKADKLLQEAYSVNIIPQQYRNIYAIWFIHDFINTSNESLTTALLHCDLDEIKQKLDTIIEQQREIIINQAVLMAQNAQMIEQNQQTLNRLAGIEQNTERASQYAQIASNNAEACAWIGMANYIKN